MLTEITKNSDFLFNVLETMRDGVMIVDDESNIIFLNKAAEEITGYSNSEVIGKQCTLLDSDTCVVLTSEGIQKRCSLFKEGTICNKRCRIRSKDGKMVYLLKNAVVLRDENNEIIGAVETMTDVTSLYLKQLELEELKEELRQEYWFMGLLGMSARMKELYEQIRNAAESEAPVLVYGESGTGKNLVASAIHKLSRRKDGPFLALNCAALNEHLLESELFGHVKGAFTGAIVDRKGRFEAAKGGSVLLDEIGDMSPAMQAKLLRVLEEKVVERVGDHNPIAVDIRLISATNKDLDEMVSMNDFREDLYYRVNTIVIRTPALRERPEDIPVLVAHYLKKISTINNSNIQWISPRAMYVLENYSWPGNVRQLISAIEHCTVTCKGDTIEVADLPDYVYSASNGQDPKPFLGGRGHVTGRDNPAFMAASARVRNARDIEAEEIIQALDMYDGHRTLAAKHLGISRVTLWKRLKELGIS
jgi:PAS domain S-box-containing protein